MSDLSYHPVLGDADRLVHELRPLRLLVVGPAVPASMTEARETRTHVADASLPSGLYSFKLDDGHAVLIVGTGAAPGAPLDADWSAPDDHALVNAYGWFFEWWDSATDVPLPAFGQGDEVLTVPSGQEATVRSRDFDAGTWWYQIRVDFKTVSAPEAALAKPAIDDDPLGWIARPPSDAHRFAATLTRAKLEEQLTDTVYSFRATRTNFRPYQFRPIIRLLATGQLRLLIADEVGLGKTIEAGLVWTELDARSLANRVLVICPSMLVAKWRAEMDERFGYDLFELTRDGLDDLLERVENDRMPARYHAVCSIERLRLWGGLERLAELSPRFDLVIVDEAHVFRNSGTRSNALGSLLSDWADALVFLSATPLNLGNEDLFNLLGILAPGEFDDRHVLRDLLEPNAVLNRIGASFFDRDTDNATRREWLREIPPMTFGPAVAARPEFADLDQLLALPALQPEDVAEGKRLVAQLHALSAVVTRTRKVEIQEHKAVREATPIEVEWTDAEREFYNAFSAWQKWRARARGLPVGFVTQMPLRLASSCLPAARNKVLAWDGASWQTESLDPSEGLDEDSDEDVEVDWDPLGDVPPPGVIQAAIDLGAVDTKFDAFLEALLPIVAQRKRVIVFTFSRAALAYLVERLRDHVRLDVLHGDVKRDERHVVMRRFRNYEFDVLLASRVASEGLDFEFCSAIVNYDLPWNPMEVEQRIGRIDRIGQTEDKIRILNFHTPGTIETDIIERVHRRIGVFRDSIGELEPILQSRLAELRRTVFDFELTDAERTRRTDEMLTAIEERKRTAEEVENATAYLSSTDQAEIDGFERDLVTSGRYVGQAELVLLMQDWAETAPGASCRASHDGRYLSVRGTTQMEAQLRGVQAAGERSASEIDQLARELRNEHEIHLCLDYETARLTGAPLLNATHPLVRAALRVHHQKQARFANLSISSTEIEVGSYLVLLSLATWNGTRPTKEFWTSTIDLRSGQHVGEAAGAGLLASLAEAQIRQRPVLSRSDLEPALRQAMSRQRHRQMNEQTSRAAANDALLETRRISLKETYARKINQIERRIATLRADGRTAVIRLHEAQLATQTRRLAEADAKLDATRHGSITVEHVAVCTVEVVAP